MSGTVAVGSKLEILHFLNNENDMSRLECMCQVGTSACSLSTELPMRWHSLHGIVFLESNLLMACFKTYFKKVIKGPKDQKIIYAYNS